MFYLLIVFVFTAGLANDHSIGHARQVLLPKFEPTLAACKADQFAALKLDAPDGVTIGAKCDGPMVDPTVPLLRN